MIGLAGIRRLTDRLIDHLAPGRGGGMVYADGSNPSVRKDIGVRLPSPALSLVRACLLTPERDRQNALVEFAQKRRVCVRRVSSILGFGGPAPGPAGALRSWCRGGVAKAYVL